MQIESLRLGTLQVPNDKIIRMTRPILGFEHLSEFCLVTVEELAPFVWLQSVEEAAIGFILVNPVTFFPGYRIEVNPREIADLQIESVRTVETYVIVTFPEDPQKMSVNLQGPILINTATCLGRQLVLVNSVYGVKHLVLEAVDKLYGSEEPVTASTEDSLAEPVGV